MIDEISAELQNGFMNNNNLNNAQFSVSKNAAAVKYYLHLVDIYTALKKIF